MKKMFSMFLAFVLFCSMTAAVAAESFQLITDKNLISAGDNVTITVKLNETMIGKYRNVQGQLKYDTGVLTYVSHEMGENYGHYSSRDIPEKKYFTFSHTDMTADGFSEISGETIATVVFKTKETMEEAHLSSIFTLDMSVQDINGNSEKTDADLSVIVCREHTWNDGEIIIPATCESSGTARYTCTYSGCGMTKIDEIPAGHVWESTYTTDKPATMRAHGSKSKHCTRCDEINADSVVKIRRIKSVEIVSLTYNGKNRTAKPSILDDRGTALKKDVGYTIKYMNAKATKKVKPQKVGKYTAVITFKGDYSGKVKRQFSINPKGSKIIGLVKGKNQFTVKWKKITKQVDGYQIRYSVKKNMKGDETVTITGNKTSAKKIKNLKAGKKYYVQIRTYKKTGGVKYYSGWSTAETIKIR